jgi:tRNA (guanine-N7-)-methyltransferase
MSILLLRLLRPGGLLDLRTDVERYALEAAERLEAEGFENEAGPGAFADAPPDEIPSTREKRYLATGQRVWRLRLRRPAARGPLRSGR